MNEHYNTLISLIHGENRAHVKEIERMKWEEVRYTIVKIVCLELVYLEFIHTTKHDECENHTNANKSIFIRGFTE